MRALFLVLLTACPAPDDTDTHTDDTDTGETDTGTDTDTDSAIDIPADNVSNVLGDCGGRFRTPDAYPNQLAPGRELQRYTLSDPEAVCNDGTRAVIYVRPSDGGPLADTWSIHVQGGGGCGNYEECATRWCGTDYYDASKMSSAYAPEEIGAVGIYDSDAVNQLAGANQVYAYFCSSDSWSGDGTITMHSEEGTGPDYTMFARGHRILASTIDELEAGIESDLGTALPSLANAERVLFSGTSAGSIGAQRHADWLTERLAGNGTEVLAVFDAANSPWVEEAPEDVRTAMTEIYRNSWAQRLAQADHVPFVDESCMDANGGTDEEWRCGTDSYVVKNHVTTPFLVRQDLRDRPGLFDTLGVPYNVFAAATRASLLAFADVPRTAVERASITRTPGAYGPNCAQHVALESTAWWTEATVENDSGTEVSFQQAVLAFTQGRDVQVVDEPGADGSSDGPRSRCATRDDGR